MLQRRYNDEEERLDTKRSMSVEAFYQRKKAYEQAQEIRKGRENILVSKQKVIL